MLRTRHERKCKYHTWYLSFFSLRTIFWPKFVSTQKVHKQRQNRFRDKSAWIAAKRILQQSSVNSIKKDLKAKLCYRLTWRLVQFKCFMWKFNLHRRERYCVADVGTEYTDRERANKCWSLMTWKNHLREIFSLLWGNSVFVLKQIYFQFFVPSLMNFFS